MTSTPVQNGNHVRPFATAPQYNFNKLTISPNPDQFKHSGANIRYSEISAKVVDWVALYEPIDITTGQTLQPDQFQQSPNNRSNEKEAKQSVFFRIVIEAVHTQHERKGFKDNNDNWCQTEELVPYTVQWTIFRRFNEFHRLFDALSGYYPDLPPMPPKEYFSLVKTAAGSQTRDEVFLAKRMLGLSAWLSTVIAQYPAILHCEDMDLFLQIHQHIVVDTTEYVFSRFIIGGGDSSSSPPPSTTFYCLPAL